MKPLQLGVFVSGRGSNFLAILKAIESGELNAKVKLVVTNNPKAGALQTAQAYGIPSAVLYRKMYEKRVDFIQVILSSLKEHDVDFVALAGYMKKIPNEVVAEYLNRMLNIHPALLPSFGGKGLYGHHVHEAVLNQGCKVSGATVHLVDEYYDRGPIVAQQCVPVFSSDTPDSLAARVLKIEHQIFPEALELFARERVQIKNNIAFIQD